MVTALDNDEQQSNLAGHMLQARDVTAFAVSLRQATPAVQQFTAATRGGLQQGQNWTSLAAVKGAWAATSYVGRNIGSASGSSFLERRLDWGLFGAGTAGAGVLGSSLLASANAGQLSYSMNQGLSIGQVGANAITHKAATAMFEKTGIDPFGVQAINMGIGDAQQVFGEIARYGGKVDPGEREWYTRLMVDQRDRQLAEERNVYNFGASLVNQKPMLSATPGADPTPILQDVASSLKQIAEALMNKVLGVATGGGG